MLALIRVAVLPALLLVGAFASPVEAVHGRGGGSIRISLSCYGNPEKTTIGNTSKKSFTIETVGSTYQPYSFEPFHVNHVLKPGQWISYQTGSAAHTNVLTHDYIYDNNGKDGARVATTLGTFSEHCSAGLRRHLGRTVRRD